MRDEAEDTIDAVAGGSTSRPETRPAFARPSAETSDYPDLATVERRHYVIRGEIAKGGMGRVLDARDLRLGRNVAIKELLPKNRDAARRFEREARITARLSHPSIIHVYEAGVWPGGEPFYAMTKVAGRSLTDVVAERKTLSERIGLLPNVIAVADAIAYAHSQDVIHRDLKPANVLVGEFGETVVIDWGLAKDMSAPLDPASSLEMRIRPAEQTLSGSIVGTPAYMPPEQARGELVDHRADVYAVGALLYKVLVGQPPYAAKTSNDVLQLVLGGPPTPVDEREPGAPPDLVAIVKKAMARDPVARYPTAAELAADLKRFETGQLVAAHHYTRRQLIVRWFERHRVAVAIGVFAFTVFAIFAALSFLRIIEEKNVAETERRKDERRRAALLEERGRAELLAGRAGQALANLEGAVRGKPDGPLGFLIAESMRPFEAEIASVSAGEGAVRVAYRPDGTEFATASEDGVVARWDATGKRVKEPVQTHSQIRALAWSADGSMLATGSDDNIVRVWRDDTVIELAEHKGAIGDVSFSPDGKRLVSASADGTARVWDLETKSNSVIAQYKTAVTVAQFSPEGMRVITGSKDGDAEVWGEIYTAPDSPLRAHTDAILSARWSPAGDRVVTTSADGTARVWDPTSGKQTVEPILHRAEVSINDAAWSRDGSRLITAGSDRVAHVWLVPVPPADGAVPEGARELARLEHPDRVIKARFSVDDRYIVTAGNDRSARVWDSKGQPIATFEHGDAVASVELSRDGTTVVTGCRDGTARVWDLTRGISRFAPNLSSPIHSIAVAPDGRVAGGVDNSHVWLWQPSEPWSRAQTLKRHQGIVLAVAFSPDGKRLVTAGEDAAVFVWSVGKEEPLELPFAEGASSVGFGADGTIVAGDSVGTLRIWSSTGNVVATVSVGARIEAIAIDAIRGTIAVATRRGVEVWSPHGERISQLATSSPLRALAFDGRGELLALAGTRDTTIARFDGKKLVSLLALEVTGDVASIALSADGSLAFTGGSDGIANVWDTAKGKLLAKRDTGGEAIESLALSKDELLWIGGTDGIARALDVHVLRDPAPLKAFIEDHVPWVLGDDDAIVRRAKK